jgi:ribosomal protein S18 acetylase RimI-like enzyme
LTRPAPNLQIRPLLLSDQPFLWECLYFAIYVPVGAPPPGLEILKSPDLSKYAADWGRPNDAGFLALDSTTGKNLGAIWLRQFEPHSAGYGFVDENIPEVSMAVIPDYRNQGIGSKLLSHLLASEKYEALSLSVSAQNPAKKLYDRFGFKVVGEKGGSYTMLWKKKI